MGERQLSAVRSMANAYLQNDNIPKDPMTEAALQLEVDWTLKKHGKLGLRVLPPKDGKCTKDDINKTAIVATHRWCISALPMKIVKQAAAVSDKYRNVCKDYDEPIISKQIPSPREAFSLFDATDQTRPDIIALLNSLMEIPYGVNIFVYSEANDEILQVQREFIRSPEGLIQLPLNATASDILEYISHQAGFMDSTCCFWCEKNKLSARSLFTCTRCKSVSYCGKECQAQDWKAFHKAECKKIVQGATRRQLGMDISRSKTWRKPGFVYPRVPMEIAPLEDGTHVFRGDQLAGFVTNIDMKTGAVGEKSKFFPTGIRLEPREHNS
jgi:hypothetical protein